MLRHRAFIRTSLPVLLLLALQSSRAETPPPSQPADFEAWSVAVNIEPLPATQGQYKCEVIVKSLRTQEVLEIPPLTLIPGKPVGETLPADAKGRTRLFHAAMSKEYPIVAWGVAVGIGPNPVLMQSGHIDLRAAAKP
jgi:hypothetical protein